MHNDHNYWMRIGLRRGGGGAGSGWRFLPLEFYSIHMTTLYSQTSLLQTPRGQEKGVHSIEVSVLAYRSRLYVEVGLSGTK